MKNPIAYCIKIQKRPTRNTFWTDQDGTLFCNNCGKEQDA